VEEGFPEVDACLRSYREALGQGDKYAFFFAPSTSGCMASVTALTSAAGKPLIGNQAADHRPFFGEGFEKLNFHASVSTFLEGRASARFAADKGWKRVGVLAPNFAYGQDVAKSFTEYFTQIVPGGDIVEEQFPELDERNFTPFINALMADRPDGIFSGFFGGFVIPFWRQWQDGGHEGTPAIGGLVDMPGWELVRSRNQIPENSYAYSRGAWQLTSLTPTGKKFHDAYVAKFRTSDHPLPLAWAQAFWSGVLMLKTLVEETESLDPEEWIKVVETGGFTYPSPYHVGETPVDPINHLSDTCAQLGRVTFDESLPVPASYDLTDTQNICMHDVLDSDEARRLTPNDVPDEAIARYEANVEKVQDADRKVPELGG
jgi:ABC-type branched-subunit amino acid transport system substrate-binding protein